MHAPQYQIPSRSQKKQIRPVLVSIITALRYYTWLCVSSLLNWHLALLLLLLWMSHLAAKIVEPWMIQSIVSTDAQLWPKLQHSLQQVDTTGVDLWEDDAKVLSGVHLEVLLVIIILGNSWPGSLRGCAHDAKDANELVFIRSPREEGSSGVHLCHDAASRPDVDAGVVRAGAEENVWSSIPECYDFIGEGVNWDAECTSKTEVCEFEDAFVVYEEVLGLEIAVEDSVCVAEVDAFEELVHKGFNSNWVERPAVALCVHVFL